MTTVQTRDQFLQSNASCLEFFSDARVVNTAMTRAQSQVIVVGDAAALCLFGKCSKIWKCYIEHCIKKGGAQPEHLTEDFVRMEVEEISRFKKTEQNFDAEDTPLVEDREMDLILQQMISDYADESHELSDPESVTESNCLESTRVLPNTHIQENTPIQTDTCKQRSLTWTWKTLTVGHTHTAHTEDEELYDDPEKGRDVVGKSFLCVLEDNFQNREQKKDSKFIQKEMVSITKDALKIRVLLLKRSRNWMPIWKHHENGDWKIADYKHIDEQLRQNYLFTVQVICWKKHCLFPLGNLIDVRPIGTTIDEALRTLNAKFKLVEQLPPKKFKAAKVDDKIRVNLQKLITFTIDSERATHLDDAISVHDAGSHYEVGIHIADVASYLRKGDELDRGAENMGATYYHTGSGEKPIFMFPEAVSMAQWSLLPNKDRRVISLIIKVDKKTGLRIHGKETPWKLSLINSNKKLTYGEVEDILSQRSENGEWGEGNDLMCDRLHDCIALAYRFSQACRKDRLKQDWLYSQPGKNETPGRRRSHLMVKELNIMFNHEMSRYLIGKEKTEFCIPLRCQKPPPQEEMKKLKERYRDLIPISAHLKHHLNGDEQGMEDGPFTVLSSVWSHIEDAAKRGQYDVLADLIGTDDCYPQLLPVISKFRDIQEKAFIIRSNSCAEATVGHYSLAVKTYTQASSPMRRYMDVVLQRLFHSVHRQTCDEDQYSQTDIDTLCKKFDKCHQKVEDYEKEAETLIFSFNLKKQSFSELASVVFVNKQEDHFIVSFLRNKCLSPGKLSLKYKDLLLDKQPKFNQRKDYVKLKWRRRVYTLHNPKVQAELKELQEGNPCIKVPRRAWLAISGAVQREDWALATTLISTCGRWKDEESESESDDDNEEFSDLDETPELQDEENQGGHYTEYSLRLMHGGTLKVQRTAEMHKGSWILRAQLLYVKPNFVVCLEHAHQPTECFAKKAQYRTKDSFRDVDEYVEIWKPLCHMVTASSAVRDSDSITIEDVQISWKQEGRKLTGGSFSLPIERIKAWRIECDLAQCYLCIKKRTLRLANRQRDDFSDPCTSFTWVVHGMVTSCKRSGMNSKDQSKTIKFDINHRSMTDVPKDVLGMDSDFSVELIPKLPPDV